MQLINLKNNQTICEDLKICRNLLDKSLGLINPKNPRNIMMETRFGIHTFFLKEPIDVLVLNKKMQVVKIKKDLEPFKLFFWNPKYLKVIELSCGAILKYRIALGDTLSIH